LVMNCAALLLCTPSLVAQQQNITTGTWRVVGGFDHPDGVLLSATHGPEDYLKKMVVGEPWPGLENDFLEGTGALAWKVVKGVEPRGTAPADAGRFDLWAACGKTGKLAAYLYLPITAKNAAEFPMMFGSDDGCAIWLNGDLVFSEGRARKLNAFENVVTLNLQAGLNHLLIKVTNQGGAWAFEMQKPRKLEQMKINRAVDRGVESLLNHQLVDGSWALERNRYRNGSTALAVYALLSSGVDPQHPAILRALAFLSCEPSDMTYSAACELMALAALNDPRYLEQIEERAEDLISWQGPSGQWAYPNGAEDLSCTQFAALGLRAAAQAGVEIPPKVWYEAIQGALLCQQKVKRSATNLARGFSYRPNGVYSGSMATAGISVLAIAREQLGENIKNGPAVKVERALKQAMDWLAESFVVYENPNRTYAHVFYWLYGVERVGALMDTKTIGRFDWYERGAANLLDRQGGNGAWADPWGKKEISTSFALLFLKKATAAATTGKSVGSERRKNPHHTSKPGDGPLSLHVMAQNPLTMWVVPPEKSTPDAVEYFVRPVGETWESIGTSSEARYAKQHTMPLRGTFEIRCVGLFEDGTTTESGIVTVDLQFGVDPTTLSYATDSLRNLVPGYRPEITISTNVSGKGGNMMADNRMDTNWLCAATDLEPTFQLKLKRKAKAKKLLFTHARTRGFEQKNNPRPIEVEIWFNRDKKPQVYAIDPDPQRKTIIELPPKSRINAVKVRITKITGGTLGSAEVGFSEVELH
jgi:hypothetical protein